MQPLAALNGKAFIPVIYHPERKIWLHREWFKRKAKLTREEAIAYAARVIWHRTNRKPR